MSIISEYIEPFIKTDLVPFATNLAIGLGVLWIGLKIVKKATSMFASRLEKQEVDPTLRPFLTNLIGTVLKVLLFITVIGILGIPTATFTAILAAAGLAIGMALSGTLQNFAGGVILLLFKPIKVGDLIEAQGYLGVVKEIQSFVTVLTTLDNKTVILPNGPLSNGAMVNFSTEEYRRVDWSFGIGYGDNTEKAREILKDLLNNNPQVSKTPELPFVEVEALADSSVNFACRAWVKQADYWDVFFKMNEQVYNTFNKEGLNIPYPQMDVHVHETK